MKKTFTRIIFLIVSLCMVAAAAAGCEGKSKELSLTEQMFNEIGALRESEYLAGGLDTYEYVALGTITAVEHIEKDIFPLYMTNFWGRGYKMPLELWEVDNTLFTLTIEEVLSGSEEFGYEPGKQTTFNVPVSFERISHWDGDTPVYTGESFTYAEPDGALPEVGDKVVLARDKGRTAYDDYFGDDYSLLVWNDKLLKFGRIKNDGKPYSDNLYYKNNQDGIYRLEAPIPEDMTLFERAYLYPLEKLQSMDGEALDEWSDYIVRGTVRSVRQYSSYPYVLTIDTAGRTGAHEAWEVDVWLITIDTAEYLSDPPKIEPTPNGTEFRMHIATEARQVGTDKVIKTPVPLPKVGDSVQFWVTLDFQDYIVDCVAKSGAGVLNVVKCSLYAAS